MSDGQDTIRRTPGSPTAVTHGGCRQGVNWAVQGEEGREGCTEEAAPSDREVADGLLSSATLAQC
jgi:hypothetical protein